ncbi:hypothetical protein ABH940_002099 [Streptacidiphilus sp. BW17]
MGDTSRNKTREVADEELDNVAGALGASGSISDPTALRPTALSGQSGRSVDPMSVTAGASPPAARPA